MADPPAKQPRRPRASVALVPVEAIQQRILVLRGHKVMLDADLAELYGVTTGRLVEAVKRNLARFPNDFMFQLDDDEFAALVSQFAISNDETPAQSDSLISQKGRGGRRTPPYVFTEQGVAMLSGVLHSDRAVAVNIAIMRAFVQLRQVLASHVELARKLDELEQRMSQHDAKHDSQIAQIVDAIRQLTERPAEPPTKPRRGIGFAPPDDPSPRGRSRRKRP